MGEATVRSSSWLARPSIDPEILRSLSQPDPFRIAGSTLRTWALVAAALGFYLHVQTIWAFIISFVVIAVQQHALSIFVHEAAHYHLARSNRWNDLLCDMFYAGPILLSIKSYRSRHWMHHGNLGTPRDSEQHPRICIRGSRVFREIVKALLGVYAFKLFFMYNGKEHGNRSAQSLFLIGGSQAVLFLACAKAGAWFTYFTLWLLPLGTLAVAISAFRAISEHQPWSVDRPVAEDESIGAMSRSIQSTPVERIAFAPLNFNYHLEHDLFPGIPYHNLPRIHQELEATGYFDRSNTAYRGTYVSLLRELAFPKKGAVAAESARG